MRTLARIGLGIVLCVGWFSLFVVVALVFAESSGLLAREVRLAIADRVGTLGEDVRVSGVRLCWFRPALEIDRVELGRDGEMALARNVRLEFELFGPHGFELLRAQVSGGHVHFSPMLSEGLREYRQQMETQPKQLRRLPRLPTLTIQDVDLAFDTRRWGLLPLGRVSALLRNDATGEPELYGRLVPALAEGSGEPGRVFLHGTLAESGDFEVRATATALRVGTQALPRDTELEFLRAFEPSALLELDARGSFRLDGSGLPRAEARLALREGSLRLPRSNQRVEDLSLDFESAWRPTSNAGWMDSQAWTAHCRAQGALAEQRFELEGRLDDSGASGTRAKAWIHFPALALEPALLELVGKPAGVARTWQALEPSGTCDLLVAAQTDELAAIGPAWSRAQFSARARFEGDTGLVYRGWPSWLSNELDQGFPLPLERITGEVVLARDARLARPFTAGLFDLAGHADGAVIRCEGLVGAHRTDVPRDAPGAGYAELDLELASQSLPLDDRLRTALRGLHGVLPPERTWEPHHPEGGSLSVALRLARTVELNVLAIDLDLGLDGVKLAWNELPVPVEVRTGRLRFRSDGKGERALALSVDGSLHTAPKLALAARFQTDPGTPMPERGKSFDELAVVVVEIERVSLTGDDKKTLVASFPKLGAALDAVAPRGFADVRYERVHASAKSPFEIAAEITPNGPVEFTPRDFPMITRDVRGRVLVSARESGAASESVTLARVMPFVGSWGDAARVAVTARFPEQQVELYGAGIDPASKSLLGALTQAVGARGNDGLDLSALAVEGSLDLTGTLSLGGASAADAAPGASGSYRLFLRDNALATAGGFRLDDLRGVLRYEQGALAGENLAGRLGETQLELTSTRFARGPKGFALEANFEARDVPIDEQHLNAFIAPRTLRTLLDELHWRGSVDVQAGRVTLSASPGGASRLEFEGRLTPHAMFIQLGLPIAIESAAATVKRLIYENGRVRALVQIDDFFGRIADRRLSSASMLLSYVEPNLSIENLSGTLEEGRIQPLGVDAQRSGTAFSISLEEPFSFLLALDLRDVAVAGLLRGLFPSHIATRGELDGELRLVGDMDHLLAINGSGSIQVRESRLWSVPVFRALFSQLGLDDTAVFDRMSTNIKIGDGSVRMEDIAVQSPLLQLVGQGAIDFDGSLKYGLEVRYDLVDRLGPFTRFIYAIQNKLLSIEIRGDMARPEVNLKNPLTTLFRDKNDPRRALPLPGYSALPARF